MIRTFTSKYRLNHHSKYIHKKDFRYCQVCNYKSNGEESLQKHMKSTHEKVMLWYFNCLFWIKSQHWNFDDFKINKRLTLVSHKVKRLEKCLLFNMHDLWHFKFPSQRGGGSGMLYCQAWGQDHDQVNSRKLQGIKKLLVILKSQGLDLQIDSIIGIYRVSQKKWCVSLLLQQS